MFSIACPARTKVQRCKLLMCFNVLPHLQQYFCCAFVFLCRLFTFNAAASGFIDVFALKILVMQAQLFFHACLLLICQLNSSLLNLEFILAMLQNLNQLRCCSIFDYFIPVWIFGIAAVFKWLQRLSVWRAGGPRMMNPLRFAIERASLWRRADRPGVAEVCATVRADPLPARIPQTALVKNPPASVWDWGLHQ